jgi:histidine triad (HIT) family protein
MSDCIFCKIVSGDIPAKIVYEDEQCVAFRDINPQAPTHILVIPRRHIETTSDVTDADATLIGHLTIAAAKIAEQEGIAESGYRMVWNCRSDAGQEVYHIHLHLFGGRKMQWPPG